VSSPPTANTVHVRFDAVQDRLVLLCETTAGDTLTLLLTRRITRRLLRAAAETLARSSKTAARSPVGFRTQVMAMEHLGALAGPKPSTAPPPKADTPPVESGSLVDRVEIRPKSEQFDLWLCAGSVPLVRVPARRAELHRLLAALDRCATQAEWDIHTETGWLDQIDAVARQPAGRIDS